MDLGEILASLPNRKNLPRVGKLADELIDLHLEYNILVKVVRKQQAEYRQLKDLFLKTSDELNTKLRCLIEAEGLEAFFAE
jgi:hypothetical protein